MSPARLGSHVTIHLQPGRYYHRHGVLSGVHAVLLCGEMYHVEPAIYPTGEDIMSNVPYLVDLFNDLPEAPQAEPTAKPHTGHCWFRDRDEYPDPALVEAFVDGGNEFREAFGSTFFPVSIVGDDADAGYNMGSTIEWETRLSDGPGAERRYLAESIARDMLFVGTARTEGVVELLELASPLAYLKNIGIDLDLYGSGGCRAWAYEVLHADNSNAMKEAVTARLAEHQPGEAWMAAAHIMDHEMSFAVFRRAESGTLELVLPWTFLTQKAGAKRCFKAVMFWRDETTDVIPWLES